MLKTCATLALLGTLTACAQPLAGWVDPLVAADRPAESTSSIGAAIDYANEAKDELYASMANQARLGTLGGLTLIPLATIGAGFAIFGKTITATYIGLAGTGTYLTGQWPQISRRNFPIWLATRQ